MKIKKYIYIAAAAILSSCQSEEIIRYVYSVGEADNTIQLMAGISDGHSGVITRAAGYSNVDASDNHSKHLAFTNGTEAALRIDGDWWKQDANSANNISQTTTATIGEETTSESKHNSVAMSPQLYWDDYGTADPANAGDGKGRKKGLTIYGAAVNGVTTAPTVDRWTAMSWNVGDVSDGSINQTSGWSTKDLLTSNNVKAGGPDDTYKFDERTSGKLLEFTHAMTKITVNLTAGEGFPGWSSSSTDGGKFQTAPTVKLLGFNYTGTVNVETKTSTPSTTATTADINAYRDNGTDWASGGQHTSQFTALVFPGNTFTATIADDENKTPTSTTDILELNADGNVLKVTAAQLVKAIAGTSTTGTSVNGTLEQGKNYILNITVNKTDIEVTATIKDWVDVSTEEALPKINVTATYGYTAGTVDHTTAFTNNYDLFRSTVKATGYDEDANSENGINHAARYTSSSSSWDKTIYWPDHQTHYFFRGVYPQVGTAVSGTTIVGAEAVTTANGNDVVAVANATYSAATYPSDLAIAIPRGTTAGSSYDETCKVTGHSSTPGICATEGVINMNFEYAMSKVEVRLKSSKTDAAHIDLTKDNTKVEIIGAYNKARIKLSDGLHDAYANADKGDYELSNLETTVTDFLVTTLDAIVPQEIGNDVLFRITYTNDNGTPDVTSDDHTDVYECKVNLINVKNSSPATPVTEWVHGKHYIYELDLNKTEIKVTATITDWVTVNASEDVWF